jgi:hypothetical protein
MYMAQLRTVALQSSDGSTEFPAGPKNSEKKEASENPIGKKLMG